MWWTSLGTGVQGDRWVGRVLRQRWTLEQVIGVGGSAVVYRATHRNGSRVAIKVLHPSLQADPVMRRRFLVEGYIANSIGVPEVVKVIDDDVEGDIAYLVMELLEGASLETIRERCGGRLAAADVVEIGCRLLAVLEAAHARGVLHRDIKPANLFRTLAPVGLKVLDFGIASIQSSPQTWEHPAFGNHGFIGTPVFMAPEQARGNLLEIDGRTDLWAVGATLFTLLTGQYVRPGRSTTEVLCAARDRKVASLGEQLRNVPQDVAVLLQRALSFEPEARFQSANEMKLACEDCRRSLTTYGRSRFFDSQAPWVSRTSHVSTSGGANARAGDAAAQGATWREVDAEPHAGYWSGRVGRVWWFYHVGPSTEETWHQYLKMVEAMLSVEREATLAFFAHRAEAPRPVQRQQLADFIERKRSQLHRLDRFALVVDSALQRGALTAVNWLVKKPFEERIFNSPLAAIKWLTEKHPQPNPGAVRDSIIGQVPRHSLWSCLKTDAPETLESPSWE